MDTFPYTSLHAPMRIKRNHYFWIFLGILRLVRARIKAARILAPPNTCNLVQTSSAFFSQIVKDPVSFESRCGMLLEQEQARNFPSQKLRVKEIQYSTTTSGYVYNRIERKHPMIRSNDPDSLDAHYEALLNDRFYVHITNV